MLEFLLIIVLVPLALLVLAWAAVTAFWLILWAALIVLRPMLEAVAFTVKAFRRLAGQRNQSPAGSPS